MTIQNMAHWIGFQAKLTSFDFIRWFLRVGLQLDKSKKFSTNVIWINQQIIYNKFYYIVFINWGITDYKK